MMPADHLLLLIEPGHMVCAHVLAEVLPAHGVLIRSKSTRLLCDHLGHGAYPTVWVLRHVCETMLRGLCLPLELLVPGLLLPLLCIRVVGLHSNARHCAHLI